MTLNYITFDLTNCTCKLYKSNVTERCQICPTNNVSLMRKNAICFVLCVPPLIRLLSPPHISAFSLGTPETLAFLQTVTSASGVCLMQCAPWNGVTTCSRCVPLPRLLGQPPDPRELD